MTGGERAGVWAGWSIREGRCKKTGPVTARKL